MIHCASIRHTSIIIVVFFTTIISGCCQAADSVAPATKSTDGADVARYKAFPVRWSWKASPDAPIWRSEGGPFLSCFQEWGGMRTLAGNGEQQSYAEPSAWKNAGLNVTTYDASTKSLVIRPRRTTPAERALTGSDVLSGMFTLEQLPKACPKLGVWRLMVKMPGQGKGGATFQGAWPALWLVAHKYPHTTYGPPEGDPYFDKHVELDIYEGHSREPKRIYVTDHKPEAFNKPPEKEFLQDIKSDTDTSDGFHEWLTVVTAKSWKVYLDGKLISSRPETSIANSYEKYLIINLAVGGKWFGNIEPNNDLSAWEMAIQSIDVYDLPDGYKE